MSKQTDDTEASIRRMLKGDKDAEKFCRLLLETIGTGKPIPVTAVAAMLRAAIKDQNSFQEAN